MSADGQRTPRRWRRSVERTPALLDPAQMPDDAEGRVLLVRGRDPDPYTPPPSPVAAAGESAPAVQLIHWTRLVALAIALCVLFTVGMVVTR